FIAIIVVTISFGEYYFATAERYNQMHYMEIKGIHHLYQGYAFYDGYRENPGIYASKGSTLSLHIINDDRDLDSMDFNIDDFNIHSKPLAYAQEQTINFLADREGIFTYYSKLHPDMDGTIIVKSQEDQAI